MAHKQADARGASATKAATGVVHWCALKILTKHDASKANASMLTIQDNKGSRHSDQLQHTCKLLNRSQSMARTTQSNEEQVIVC